MYQKDNSTTHPDLWCEHYEANMDKKEKLEAAMSKMSEEAMDYAVEDKYDLPIDRAEDSTTPGDVLGELNLLLNGLNEFDKNCQHQLVMAARADNNMLVAETKGMMRVTTMLGAQLNARIEELSKRTMN